MKFFWEFQGPAKQVFQKFFLFLNCIKVGVLACFKSHKSLFSDLKYFRENQVCEGLKNDFILYKYKKSAFFSKQMFANTYLQYIVTVDTLRS